MSLLTKIKVKLYECRRKTEFKKHLRYVSSVSPQEAEERLRAEHGNEYPCFEQHNDIDPRYDVMIIIPVYNAEKYVDECLRSVLGQKTKFTYSVTVINDGSTDQSLEIINRYADRENVMVIDQPNQGVSAARNHARRHINASYVMFVDADDYLPEDAVEVLLTTAFEKDADIVQGGYHRFGNPASEGIFDKLTSVAVLSAAEVSGYACMKVIRSEKLKNFCFPIGYRYEDAVTELLLYPQCDKMFGVPHVVYFYRSHAAAFCSETATYGMLDSYWITRYGLEEIVKRGYTLDETEYRHYLRLCHTNWLRMPEALRESMFVLTAEQYERVFGKQPLKYLRYRLLDRALKSRSYRAFEYVMKNWENL